MKWDAGALSPYRYNSPMYRYLSSNPPRLTVWPKHYREELGIFLATPGVSWRWIMKNFNMTEHRLSAVFNHTKHLHHLAMENAMSATLEDAIMYMKHRPHAGEIPFWVEPFIMDDIKNGLGWRPSARKWNISTNTVKTVYERDTRKCISF